MLSRPEFPRRVEPGGAAIADISGPSNGIVLGIVYQDDDYGGNSRMYTAFSGCSGLDDGDPDHQEANIGSYWNDRITSFQSFSHCQTQLYVDINFHGAKSPLATWGRQRRQRLQRSRIVDSLVLTSLLRHHENVTLWRV